MIHRFVFGALVVGGWWLLGQILVRVLGIETCVGCEHPIGFLLVMLAAIALWLIVLFGDLAKELLALWLERDRT